LIIKRIADYILGTYTVNVPEESKKDLTDRLIKERIGFEISDDRSDFSVKIRSYDLKKIDGLTFNAGEIRGLPRIFKRYGKRWGIYIGILIVSVMVILSQRIVWRIDIKGCADDKMDGIMSNLESLGFTYGTDFKSADLDSLHNDYLRKFDDLSWISVNMKGTWATVEVKEAVLPDERDTGGVKNVTAAESGVITGIAPKSGKPVVGIGDFVSMGDLLISGIITVGENGLRFAPSEGSVFAEVKRNFTVEIPKVSTIKRYTGDEFIENELIFFKKSVKLSGNYRISQHEYDTIYNKERLDLFGVFPLPVFKEMRIYREYDEEFHELTYDDAAREFDVRYPGLLSATLGGARLIEVNFIETESDDAYIREYEVICEADIAERKDIEVK